jgi:hypothetical protein
MHTYSHPDIHASLCACVETCVHYYIVTYPGSNIYIRYVEAIYKMLKPGGIWINLGPLLYHWVADSEANNDDRYGQSIEVKDAFIYILHTYIEPILHAFENS